MKDNIPGEILDSIDASTRLPYGVSRYYRSLATSENPETDPIAAQYMPREAEKYLAPGESSDPLSDDRYSVAPRVIHHYKDRILVLVNDRCATYCRHCFRRHFTGNSTGRITPAELAAAAEYIKQTPEVQEVLLSGGDPLMLSDEELAEIIKTLRDAAGKRAIMFRLATRMPVVLPSRITHGLIDRIKEASRGMLWVVTHANHPQELTVQFEQATARFIDNGIPVLNQAVLLKGVNDSPDTLETLFRRLIQLRVKPYYLFQGDLASGTRHFRTSIDRGLQIMDELRKRLSGIAMPSYALDLPDGGGKVILEEHRIVKRSPEGYHIRGNDGRTYFYSHTE